MTGGAFIFYSMPLSCALGLLLVAAFSIGLRWLPARGPPGRPSACGS